MRGATGFWPAPARMTPTGCWTRRRPRWTPQMASPQGHVPAGNGGRRQRPRWERGSCNAPRPRYRPMARRGEVPEHHEGRRSEVLGLAWSAVDLDRGRIQIVRNLQRVPGEGLKFFDPKSSRSRRMIVLPPFVIPQLRAVRADQAERRLVLGVAWTDLDLVCERGDGQPLDPDSFSHATKRLMKKAGLDPATRLHDLRHGLATALLEQGVDVAVVSAVLGHASPAFTMSVYQHVREGMAEQAAEAIEQAFGQ